MPWKGFFRRTLKRSQNLVGNIHIGVDILHVIQVFEHFDKTHELLGTGRIHGHGGGGDHRDLAIFGSQASLFKGRFYRAEVLPGAQHVNRAVIVELNVLGSGFQCSLHNLVRVCTSAKLRRPLRVKR